MDRGADRLVRVIDDLLLLSKVGDPANPVIPSPVDLHLIVDDAVELCSVPARRKRLVVTVDSPPGPQLALGDLDELDRVCTNLVSNAVKYTPDGGHIIVRLERVGDQMTLACTDDGIGISEADQEGLFSEFFRSSNPLALKEPGTGLGLAIVRRILQRHDGRIEVTSALGEGSTFQVWLPAAAPL